MGDPFDPANPGADPLRSADDNYQNLGGLPYANLDPNAAPGAADPAVQPPPLAVPPPPGVNGAPVAQNPPSENPPPDPKVPASILPGDPGDGPQELPDSDPSSSKKKVDKPKIKKLKKKMQRVKYLFWAVIAVWIVFLLLFVLIHLNNFGIHLLPFLKKE